MINEHIDLALELERDLLLVLTRYVRLMYLFVHRSDGEDSRRRVRPLVHLFEQLRIFVSELDQIVVQLGGLGAVFKGYAVVRNLGAHIIHGADCAFREAAALVASHY